MVTITFDVVLLAECCLDQNSYRNLIAGKDKRLLCRLLRFLLWGVSLAYGLSISVRNYCYNAGIFKSHAADAPVISIGNITTGGTGKTPLVVWLCRYLGRKNISCAVLTRGYKAGDAKIIDEPAILAKSCPDTKIVVNADRVEGAAKSVDELAAKVLVMDDGFQHRRLKRDLDIIAIDATCPFGYGRMLPAGLLREPVKSIKRADAAVITRYDQARPEEIGFIVSQIRKISPDIAVAMAVHKHTCAKIDKDNDISMEELKGKKVFAFCGVGNPKAFLNNLRNCRMEIAGSQIYNDHHDYKLEDIEDIYAKARQAGAEMVLSTEKDWVKVALLLKEGFSDIVFAYLVLELDFIEGLDKIEGLVDASLGNN